jgi:outer membrane protein TolC
MLSIIGTPAFRRAWTRSCVVLFAFGLLAGGAAHAEDAGLTLDETLQIATSRSSSIQAAQASVRGSSDVVVKAGQLPNPTLNLSVQDLPINGPNAFTIGQDNFTMRGIGVQQEWVSPAKRRLQTTLADRAVERDQSTYLEKVAEVRQQAAMAWLNAIYAKRAVVLSQALVDHLSQELTARQASYRGAKGTAVDVAQANLMLGNARDELISAQQDEQTALITLSRWTGAGNVLGVAGTPPELQSQVSGLSLEQLAQVQPSLIAARAAISLADADTDVTRSNRNPNWTWGLTYFKSGGRFPDYVSVRRFHSSADPPQERRRPRRRAEVRDGYPGAAHLRRHRAAGRRRYPESDGKARQWPGAAGQSARQTVLPAAEQKVQLANAAYRSGAGTLSDALDARHTQLEADLQVLNLEREASLVWAQLEYQVLPPDMTSGQ